MGQPLALDIDAIAHLCRKFGVSKLSVFGSATTDRFDPERSDVDFLLEFLPEAKASFKTLFGLKLALQDLLGRDVDVVMPKAMRNRYFAESVAKSRQELYAA